ncbi:unnamed protein product [Phytophthora fragariaefolia]|uniref:Unnamed protein product n=1 Tax=Phytophthora fragariaefolia TaxID=1490495 RepID=A0A9W7D3Y0_9STRA|nr:unnamed protein product [Phytophthora fragariaefolia]
MLAQAGFDNAAHQHAVVRIEHHPQAPSEPNGAGPRRQSSIADQPISPWTRHDRLALANEISRGSVVHAEIDYRQDGGASIA